jgi:hypothetical protein
VQRGDRPGPGRRAGIRRSEARLSTLGRIVYHVLALLSLLIHLAIGGLLTALTLSLVPPPGAAVVALILKGLVIAVWGGFAILGVIAWRDRRWSVIAVPIVAFLLVGILKSIGDVTIGWTLGIGY